MHRAAAGAEKSVVIVESFFDCIKVHQAGRRTVVGLMGSTLYESQRHTLLDRFRHVILLLDGDPTGCKASTVITQKLGTLCSVRVIRLPTGVQPDQMATGDIGEILRSRANGDYKFGNISK
jgi:DNA primase